MLRASGGDGEDVVDDEILDELSASNSTLTLRQLKKSPSCAALINLALDYVLGHIILQYRFPSPDGLKEAASECLSEAQTQYPRLHPEVPLDPFFGNRYNFTVTSNRSDVYL